MTGLSLPDRGTWAALGRLRDRDHLLLALAAAVVLVEVLGLAGVVPYVWIGDFRLPPSILPSIAVAAMIGPRLVGRARDARAAAVMWALVPALGAAAFVAFARAAGRVDAFALVTASANEEVVYRFAVPAVVTTLLSLCRTPVRAARVTGFLVGAVWFVLLPGHRDQMSSVALAVPFVAFALLTAVVVYRSGALAVTALAHCTLNLCTFLVLLGRVDMHTRSLVAAVTLLLVVAAYGRSRSRTISLPRRLAPPFDLASPVDDGLVIDLRDRLLPADVIDVPVVDRRAPYR